MACPRSLRRPPSRRQVNKRTGWVLRQVPEPESIADHMYRMATMTLLLAGSPGIDFQRCMMMAVVHDMAEGALRWAGLGWSEVGWVLAPGAAAGHGSAQMAFPSGALPGCSGARCVCHQGSGAGLRPGPAYGQAGLPGG